MSELLQEVARLTGPQRRDRVAGLIAGAHALVDEAEGRYVLGESKVCVAIAVLFSGGNDSTVLAHLMRNRATHFAHANTGVGIEQTRQFVRDTAAAWNMPLLERSAPRSDDSYREMVLAHGFPGPGHHYKMYQRLKERALRQVQKELVGLRTHSRRVMFLAGRRRDESKRRANVTEIERVGSVVWVSPLANWTRLDLNTYRLMHLDVPVNEVSDLIHMSGECLCGSFAHKDERAEIEQWFPDAFAEIADLERMIADRDDIAEHAKRWGWGWNWPNIRDEHRQVGRLCSSCEAKAS